MNDSEQRFPAVRLWALDPLYRCSIKLFISQILQLQELPEFQDVFLLYDHPVTRFEVVGVVTSVERKEKFIKYRVDDGTGSIQCCQWLQNNQNPQQLDLGALVSVAGKLHTFREEREINVDRITVETDPNFEPFHWLEVIRAQETYKKPAVLPKDILDDL